MRGHALCPPTPKSLSPRKLRFPIRPDTVFRTGFLPRQ